MVDKSDRFNVLQAEFEAAADLPQANERHGQEARSFARASPSNSRDGRAYSGNPFASPRIRIEAQFLSRSFGRQHVTLLRSVSCPAKGGRISGNRDSRGGIRSDIRAE